jgi:hypothetical protein
MEYRNYGGCVQIHKGEINWGLGFILPKTVYPAITVFPMSKLFGERRGGGRSIVEYRFSIDVFSKRYPKAEDAKSYVLRVIEDIKKCVKGAISMPYKDGKKHSFATTIMGVGIRETMADSGKAFQSEASVNLSCSGYHDMNSDRIRGSIPMEVSSEDFLKEIYSSAKLHMGTDAAIVKKWQVGISKPILHSPVIQILPVDETLESETLSQSRDVLTRPYMFNVVSREFPRTAAIKSNIELADNLVIALEADYQLGGRAMNVVIDSITYDYTGKNEGFQFYSSVSAEYESWQTYGRILH